MYSLGYIFPFVYRPRMRGFGQADETVVPDDVPEEKPVTSEKFVTPTDTLVAKQRAALLSEGVSIGMREGLSLSTKFGLALGLGIAAIALGGTAVAALVRKTRGQAP